MTVALKDCSRGNNAAFGRERDRAILRTLEEWRVMDSWQITAIHFADIEYGHRKCQDRLLKLFKKNKVVRWMDDDGYVYALDEKPGRAEHMLAVNWVRVYLQSSLANWEKMHCFDYESDYAFMRPDAFTAIKNTFTGEFRFFFVELDRSQNKFDKVRKYSRLYEEINTGHFDRWWLKLTTRFPTIMVVTTSQSRKEKILQLVAEENQAGLNFDVRLLSDVRKEVVKK